MDQKVLEVKGLKTYFFTKDGVVPAVDGVDFDLNKGETLGIVGESGCGKTVTALSLIGLVPHPGKIVKGSIRFKGENLMEKSQAQLRKIRGRDISMIFQEPRAALNPMFTIGTQIKEVLKIHYGLTGRHAREKVLKILMEVGIPSPKATIRCYPHQLSRGMIQRAAIAMALACRPELLIADEPTACLDVTIQAQILNLMNQFKDRLKTAMIFITHDFSIISQITDKVIVMYAGKIVECSDTRSLLENPLHPYTTGLLKAVPQLDHHIKKFYEIEGELYHSRSVSQGCKFYPRCKAAVKLCKLQEPPLIKKGYQRHVRCWKYFSQKTGKKYEKDSFRK